MKLTALWRYALVLYAALLPWAADSRAASREAWIDGCVEQLKQTSMKLGQTDRRFKLSDSSDGEAHLTIFPNGVRYRTGDKQHFYSIEVLRQPEARPLSWRTSKRPRWHVELFRRTLGASALIIANLESVTEADGDAADRRSVFLPAAKDAAEACLKLASFPTAA